MNLNSEITQIEYNVNTLSYRLFICIAGNTSKIDIDSNIAIEIINSIQHSTSYGINCNVQKDYVFYEVVKA